MTFETLSPALRVLARKIAELACTANGLYGLSPKLPLDHERFNEIRQLADQCQRSAEDRELAMWDEAMSLCADATEKDVFAKFAISERKARFTLINNRNFNDLHRRRAYAH